MNEYELLLAATRKGEVVQTLTLISAPDKDRNIVGKMLLLFSSGHSAGQLSEIAFGKHLLESVNYKNWIKPCTIDFMYEGELYRVFWDTVGSDQFRVIILGGGHISEPLAKMFSLLDYYVTVVDDRPEFANKQRFQLADAVICDDFMKALQQLEADEKTAVIIVTRGHRHDLDCLRLVLNKKTGYTGMIGSGVKVRAARKVLEEEGFDKTLLSELRAPIGLDIGAQTPAEIAVSIVAEVVEVFRGGNCLPLSRRHREGD